MSQAAAAEPVPAASVIVLDSEARTVLLLRRLESLRFMGGFWVFPGGAVDPGDREPGDARGADAEASARAACRELREEAGLQLRPADLVPWAHWITPAGASRRFDTRFFLALRPREQTAWLASGESTALRWAEPAWVAGAPDGFPVTAPTIVESLEIAAVLREAGADAVLDRARRRAIRAVVPKLHDGTAVMPWDAEYAALPGVGVAWDERGCAERASCPSRFPAFVPTGRQ